VYIEVGAEASMHIFLVRAEFEFFELNCVLISLARIGGDIVHNGISLRKRIWSAGEASHHPARTRGLPTLSGMDQHAVQ